MGRVSTVANSNKHQYVEQKHTVSSKQFISGSSFSAFSDAFSVLAELKNV